MFKYSPDGKLYTLGYGGADNHVIAVYDSESHKKVLEIKDISKNSFSFSPDSKLIATIFKGITIYDITTERKIWNFKPNLKAYIPYVSPQMGSSLQPRGSMKPIGISMILI